MCNHTEKVNKILSEIKNIQNEIVFINEIIDHIFEEHKNSCTIRRYFCVNCNKEINNKFKCLCNNYYNFLTIRESENIFCKHNSEIDNFYGKIDYLSVQIKKLAESLKICMKEHHSLCCIKKKECSICNKPKNNQDRCSCVTLRSAWGGWITVYHEKNSVNIPQIPVEFLSLIYFISDTSH